MEGDEDQQQQVNKQPPTWKEKAKQRKEKLEQQLAIEESAENEIPVEPGTDDDEHKVILSGKLVYNKKVVLCTLTKIKLTIIHEPKSGSILLDDIFAVHENLLLSQKLKSPCFSIFTYNRLQSKKFVHDFQCVKPEELQQWVTVIRCVVFQAPMSMPDLTPATSSSSSSSSSESGSAAAAASASSSNPLAQFNKKRKLLVILNPFSGKKQGRQLFNKYAKPILDVAHLQYQVQETEGPLHATKIVQSLNLKEVTEIACMGGDGILNEVLNGLMKREDWSTAIKTPLAVIPSGTSNAVAAAVKTTDVEKAAFAIARGYYHPIDVFSVFQGSNRYFAILSVNWAVIADADHGTENIRFLGGLRNQVGALKAIAKMKYYKGRFKYVPHNPTNARPPQKKSLYAAATTSRRQSRAKPEARAGSSTNGIVSTAAAFGGHGPECPLLNKYFSEDFQAVKSRPAPSANKKPSSKQTAPLLQNESTTTSPLPSNPSSSSTSPVESSTVVARTPSSTEAEIVDMTDDFFMWVAMNVTHLALDVLAAPNAQMDNGAFDVIMMRKKKVGRGKILQMFLEIETGGHIQHDEVEEVRAKAFMLDPVTTGSFVSIDGECIKYEPVFCEVHASLANIICL